jgi:hypothetical protein
MTVIDENGNKTEKNIDYNYIFPHTVISHSIDLKDIQTKQKKLIDSGKDGSKLPDSFYKLNGLYGIWNSNDILSGSAGLKVRLNDNEKEIIQEYKTKLYSFFCCNCAFR